MLTAVVLTHNSASSLSPCLASLKFCDAVVVVDGNSVDDTVSIAKKFGARVINFTLEKDYSAKRNYALSQIKSHWLLFVDSDEIVSEDLSLEILQAIKKIEYKGFYIKRIDYLWGQKLKHGDVGNKYFLRLGRNGAGNWVGDVHEKWQIEGRVGKLKGQLIHYPHQNLVEFIQKINFYSSLRSAELYRQKAYTNLIQVTLFPFGKFLHLYLFKAGFLDGTAGFIHSVTMAFYTFLTRGKLYLLCRRTANHV